MLNAAYAADWQAFQRDGEIAPPGEPDPYNLRFTIAISVDHWPTLGHFCGAMRRTVRSEQKAATCGVVGDQDPSGLVRIDSSVGKLC